MEKFKVGDRVRVLVNLASGSPWRKGDEFVIGEMGEDNCCDKLYQAHWVKFNQIELVSSNKYQSLKSRIQAINQNTTVKEWDDLLGAIYEVRRLESPYYINIFIGKNDRIELEDAFHKVAVLFHFTDQCSKGEAIKKAMLWLLENSDIKKDDHAEEIAEINKQIAELNSKVEKLSRA